MTPPEVLASLRARGFDIAAAGDQLRIRPAGVLTAADREVLTAMKPALLRLLGDTPPDRQASRACDTRGTPDVVAWGSDGGPLADRLVVDAVLAIPEPVAWRLYSRRLERELWLARDAEAAAELDRDGAREGLPVVLADDLAQLRSFDDRRLADLLDALAIFPGARLAQLDPEAAS